MLHGRRETTIRHSLRHRPHTIGTSWFWRLGPCPRTLVSFERPLSHGPLPRAHNHNWAHLFGPVCPVCFKTMCSVDKNCYWRCLCAGGGPRWVRCGWDSSNSDTSPTKMSWAYDDVNVLNGTLQACFRCFWLEMCSWRQMCILPFHIQPLDENVLGSVAVDPSPLPDVPWLFVGYTFYLFIETIGCTPSNLGPHHHKIWHKWLLSCSLCVSFGFWK